MIKKIFIFILIFISNCIFVVTTVVADNEDLGSSVIMDALTWLSDDNILPSDSEEDWLTLLTTIFIWVKDSLTWFLFLIAIWVFLYIWIKIAIARWNPEEFKKAIIHLVYAIVWIFVVGLAWALVTLVAWLNP